MFATLTLLLAALPPFEASDAISHDAQAKALAATVRLADRPAWGGPCGTGTVVGRQGTNVYYVLTAEHCLVGKDLELELFTSESYPNPSLRLSTGISVVARSKATDLALLRVITNEQLPASIRICPPGLAPKGKFDVITVGCSGGRAPSVWLSQTLGTTWATVLQGNPWLVEMNPERGRSGGALLDERGLLIGVCSRSVAGEPGKFHGVYSDLKSICALCDDAGLSWLYQETKDTHFPVSTLALLFLKIMLAEILMMLMARKADSLPGHDPADTAIKAYHARWNLLIFLIFNTLVLLAWQDFAAEYGLSIPITIGLLLAQYGLAGWFGRPTGFGPKHPLVLLIPFQSAILLLIPTPTWHPQVFTAGYVFLGFAIRVMAAPTIAPQEAARARTDSTQKVTNAEQTFAQPTALPDRCDAPVCIP